MIRERRINLLKNILKFSKDYLIIKDYLKSDKSNDSRDLFLPFCLFGDSQKI